MCTSMTMITREGKRLFGRTLDLDTHFGERVVRTPRGTSFCLGDGAAYPLKHALLGMAAVAGDYPLYAEAMNDDGLCMAGLRFAGEARYADTPASGKINLAPWELIPALLGSFSTVGEVREALRDICILDRPFSAELPAAPLHWHVADADPTHGELVVEATAAGLTVYPNPAGVLTNSPDFPGQLAYLERLSHLTSRSVSENGDGGEGMPGDYTSKARFARAALLRRWCGASADIPSAGGDGAEVSRFFGLLAAVAPPRGAVLTMEGGVHRTLYACCMDGAAGAYHYITEEDGQLKTARV